MNKVIIFSHESDIDGLGCVILAKLAFSNIDYILSPNTDSLEIKFREYINSNKLDYYDKIFVTDLALYEPALTMVAESSLKDKVLVFDHHKAAIEKNLNRYTFTTIKEEDIDGKKRCATDLLYEYLITNNYLKPSLALDDFVEFTRLEDGWLWKQAGKFGEQAHDLAILFNCIGIEKYLSTMLSQLSSNPLSFVLSNNDKSIIQDKKDEYDSIMKKIMESAEYFIDDEGNKFGIVFAAYEYRNELPEFIINNNNPESIKYLIIVAMDKGEFGQKSYRKVADSFDVNSVAMKHGGGGHPGAAAVNITKEQKEKSMLLSKRESLKFLADSSFNS